MIYHTIWLDYHLVEWKKAWKILLEKMGKKNFRLVKSYQVISLFNCINKVIEKVIANKFFFYCKNYSKLYPR